MKEARKRIKQTGFQILTFLIDTVYLVLWMAANWFVNNIVKPWCNLEGMDLFMFNVFQVVGFASTFLCICYFFAIDIMSMWYKGQKDISSMRKKSKH